jgi:Lrp/AsnC family leucine-responsive transcriptional regulator
MTSRTESALDAVDWRILEVLQEDARYSYSELGRRIGRSAPAVAERVRRMEAAGIITGYSVSLALDKLGYAMTAIIRISAPEENCIQLGALVRRLPNVIESHRVTGTDRLIVKVMASSVGHLDDTISQLSKFGTATASIVLSSRTTAARAPATSGRSANRTTAEIHGRSAR